MPHSRSPSPTRKGPLQASQCGPSAGLASAVAITDAAAREVVRAHFDAYPIAKQDTDAEFAHLAARVGKQLVPVVELDLELRVGQRIHHCTVHLDGVVLGHAAILGALGVARSRVR